MPNNFDKLFNQAQGNELINALKGIKSSLDVNYPLETVNVTLSNNAQNITPSENYYGLGQVNIPGMNLSDMTILVNGNYDPVTSGLDGYGKLNVNVPTWGQADEGKVVSNNALVPQTNREVNANGTYDTTLNNSVLVNVPNTYGSEDEGKVVMNNALVPQTNRSITQNGTYDTTTNDEVVVNVEGGGSGGSKNILSGTEAPASSIGEDGDIYLRYRDIPLLPTGYESLSYIQGTGTQFITTDYTPNVNTEVKIELSPQYISDSAILGADWTPNGYFLMFYQNKVRFHTTAAIDSPTVAVDERYIIETDKSGFTLNGTRYNGNTASSFANYALSVFGTTHNPYPETNVLGRFKLYSLTISESGTRVRKLVPAKRLSDNAIGLYDIETDTFFENDGTSTFESASATDDIVATYCKVNGEWQSLEGTDIDDVNTEGSGGAKNILGGTTNPTSADGMDGDIYIKYTDYGEIEGYSILEYLGVGDAAGPYIDTGFNFTTKSEFEVKAQYTNTPNSNSWLFGAYTSYKQTDIGFTNNLIWIQTGGSNRSKTFDTAAHVYQSTQNAFIIDGEVLTGATPNWANTTTNSAKLFYIGDSAYSNKCRIYYCKIWDDGALVRNLVPAKRNSDDVLGLYDLVNDVFYTNSGTGAFVGGEEITGTPIDTVYLKVNGDWIILEDGDYSEVNTGGISSVVLSGTETPTSAIGENENLYVKYVVEPIMYDYSIGIDSIYRKVNGAWVEYTEPVPPTKGVHIWTKSTGGYDAAMYVQNGYWDVDNDQFVATGEIESVIYTSVQSSTYDCYGIATLRYSNNWFVYATDNVTDGTNQYSSGNQVRTWKYNTSVDFYVWKDV